MKILYVTHYRDLLGANRSLLQLILELRDKGVEPTVLMPYALNDEKPDFADALKKENIPYIEAPLRGFKHNIAWRAIPAYMLYLKGRHKVLKALVDRKFDLVHSNSSTINIGSYIAKKFNARHVWHLREFGDLDYDLKTPFGKWFQHIAYKGNSHFIAISQKILNHFKPYIGNQEISLIYNGVKISSRSIPFHAIDNIVRFCVVGLVYHNKGQLDIVKAIHQLVNKRGIKSLHLTIVGGAHYDYLSEIENFISENDLGKYVELTGQRTDVPDILATQDVGIMSSANEAFGRVTIEYMLAGLAVIATDGGANCEILDDGKNGLIYPAGDINALADSMQSLIDDRKLLSRIAKNGFEKAIENFSSEANSNNIFKLYQSVLSE